MKTKYLKYILLVTILILLLFIILYIYKFSTQKEYLDTTYQKTIYLVWCNKIENSETFWGFGDKLRGAITLNQYCNENNINFKIDGTDDICSDYLKNIKSIDYPLIKDKPLLICIQDSVEQLKEMIHNELLNKLKEMIHNELLKKNVITIFTNVMPNDLSDKDKEFAKKICEPNDSLAIEINEKMKKLPINYGIKHFRFNDKVFQNDVDSTDALFKKYYELLQSDYKTTDVLITNSYNFKKYAKEKLGIITIDCDNELCKIQHIGHSTEKEPVKNSFIEFFIICKSSYIKTYTCYLWPSNFVSWSSKIYNIPLNNEYIDEENIS